MGFYDVFMFPIEKACIGQVRREMVGLAKGKTLEVGVGTGANLDYYSENVTSLFGVDIIFMPEIRAKSERFTQLLESPGELLPFPDESFDTVVATLVLCSVNDVAKSLAEIKRVLKPNGSYIFVEHILPHGKLFAGLCNAINPPWHAVAMGCNMNRKTDNAIAAQFDIQIFHRKLRGWLCYGLCKK